eukprot:TRINITY_DN238_c0_g1_i2.p1 TRINITY_DN238_c0_g1~~TRINITY_DN238_c0_g1_i2.p1  ORF type:complete len:587 (-),score=119.58 TRINITY_DN238_c0_g1_i2:1-1761(-)
MSGPHYGNGVGNIQGTRQGPNVNVVSNTGGYTYTAPAHQDWNQQGVPPQQSGQPVQNYDASGHAPYMSDWRSQLTKEDRNRIVYKIIEVLSQCVVVDPNQPTSKTDPQLIAMAHKYEENVLSLVSSKNEYFEKIAAKLYDLKTKNTKKTVPPPTTVAGKQTMSQMPQQNVQQQAPQAHLAKGQPARLMEMPQHPHMTQAYAAQTQTAPSPQPQQMPLPQLAPQTQLTPIQAQQLSQAQQIAQAQLAQPHAAPPQVTAKPAKGRQLAAKLAAVQQSQVTEMPNYLDTKKPEMMEAQPQPGKPNIMAGLVKAAAKQENKQLLQQQLHQLQQTSVTPMSTLPSQLLPQQTAQQVTTQSVQAQQQAQAQAQAQVQSPPQLKSTIHSQPSPQTSFSPQVQPQPQFSSFTIQTPPHLPSQIPTPLQTSALQTQASFPFAGFLTSANVLVLRPLNPVPDLKSLPSIKVIVQLDRPLSLTPAVSKTSAPIQTSTTSAATQPPITPALVNNSAVPTSPATTSPATTSPATLTSVRPSATNSTSSTAPISVTQNKSSSLNPTLTTSKKSTETKQTDLPEKSQKKTCLLYSSPSPRD